MKKLILFALSIAFIYQANASHIVGAELFYDCTGNNNYHITLKLYRNCYCINCANYGDPEYVTIFNAQGTVVTQVAMPKPDTFNLPPTYTNACQVPPAVCITEADYTGNVVLPPVAGGYTVVYQRCCRNDAVVNLVAGQGATYIAEIPDSGAALGNNSARFTALPPLFVCVNQPLNLNYAATDPDGDSLVYSLCDPYLGADGNCPDPSPNAPSDGSPNCPTAPNSPPYQPAAYGAGYNALNFTNNPATANDLTIDPHTGILTGIPNQVGVFAVTVCVSEYRNGHLLNVLRRDFQVAVTPCDNPIAVLPATQSQCNSLTANFSSQSYVPVPGDSITYFWNFGVPGSTTDTSSLATPSFTYPGNGTYTVQLIAHNSTNGLTCADTATSVVLVYPTFSDTFNIPSTVCVDSPVTFIQQSVSTSGTVDSLLWNFGDGATSTLPTVTHVFTYPRTYQVSLYEQNTAGCFETVTNNIFVGCPAGVSTVTGDAADIRIYPNPANDNTEIYYNIPAAGQAVLTIFNQLGQPVLNQTLPTTGSYVIKTSQLSNGVYNYQFTINGLLIKRDRFLIVR